MHQAGRSLRQAPPGLCPTSKVFTSPAHQAQSRTTADFSCRRRLRCRLKRWRNITNSGSISGGEDGVYGMVPCNSLELRKISASVDDGIGLLAGGSVTNAAGAQFRAWSELARLASTSQVGRAQSRLRQYAGNKYGTSLTSSGADVTNNRRVPVRERCRRLIHRRKWEPDQRRHYYGYRSRQRRR